MKNRVGHPWGLRDFHILDLERNRIGFGQTFERAAPGLGRTRPRDTTGPPIGPWCPTLVLGKIPSQVVEPRHAEWSRRCREISQGFISL